MNGLRLITKTRAVLHTIAIIASAIVSALAAYSAGGDPSVGVAVGVVTNGAIAVATA